MLNSSHHCFTCMVILLALLFGLGCMREKLPEIKGEALTLPAQSYFIREYKPFGLSSGCHLFKGNCPLNWPAELELPLPCYLVRDGTIEVSSNDKNNLQHFRAIGVVEGSFASVRDCFIDDFAKADVIVDKFPELDNSSFYSGFTYSVSIRNPNIDRIKLRLYDDKRIKDYLVFALTMDVSPLEGSIDDTE